MKKIINLSVLSLFICTNILSPIAYAQTIAEGVEPVVEGVEPVVEGVEPETEVVEPKTELVEPVVEGVEPETEVVEPKTELVEPVVEGVEPETEVVEPETELVEPVVEGVEPETEVVEPETEVVEPETEVVEPEKKMGQIFSFDLSKPNFEDINTQDTDLTSGGCFTVDENDYITQININKCGFNWDVNLSIPEGIKGIYWMRTISDNELNSFKSRIKSIIIPDSVEYIQGWLFQGASQCQSLKLGKGLKEIQDGTFAGIGTSSNNGLSKLDLSNVEVIGNNAFQGASNLSKLTIGSNLKNIGEWAFAGTKIYSKLDLPNIEYIGNGAFNEVSTLRDVTFGDKLETVGDMAFNKTSLTSVNLSNIKEIGQQAFAEIKSLNEIIITGANEGVVIKMLAFSNSLSNNVVITNAKKIGKQSFQNNKSLKNIEILGIDNGVEIEELAFNSSTSKDLKVVNFKKIGWQAFAGMELDNVYVEGIEQGSVLGDRAFWGCYPSEDNELNFEGKNIIYVGDRFFAESQFSNVSIDGNGSEEENEAELCNQYYKGSYINGCEIKKWNGTILGDGVFQDTPKLENVRLGKDITYMGSWGFGSNSNPEKHSVIKNVIIEGSEKFGTELGQGAFANTPLENVEIGTGVTVLGMQSFSNTNVESLVLPNTVRVVGNMSFQGANIKNIEIPGNVNGCVIETGAFRASKLENLVIGTGVSLIMEQSFQNLPTLKSVSIEGNGNTIVQRQSFDGAVLLESLSISGVSFIGDMAFHNDPNIKNITINGSENGTIIGENAFKATGVNIVTLNLGNGISAISGSAFQGLEIETIDIPDSVEYIGQYAFSGSKVKNLTLGSGIKYIGTGAFGNSNLDTVIVSSIDFTMGENALTYDHSQPVKFLTDLDVSQIPASKVAEFEAAGVEFVQGYRIEFINDGKLIDSAVYYQGDEIVLPDSLSKEGYNFKGWSGLPEIDEDGKYYMPANKVIAIAQWESNAYSGGGNSGGGGGGGSKKSETSDVHGSAEETDSSMLDGGETIDDFDAQESSIKNVVRENEIDSLNKSNKYEEKTVMQNSSNYTQEQRDAYLFAKSNGITTTSTIEQAKMNTSLTRIAMAKMLSYYAINILGQQPDISKGAMKFKDVSDKLNLEFDNGVTLAYQLGIMGQNMKNNEFRPNDEVTRAEFVTALSRMLYGMEDGKGNMKYYEPHMAKLYSEGIISNTDPKLKEKRGYVMLMLMRSVK